MSITSITQFDESVLTHTALNAAFTAFKTNYNGLITDDNLSDTANINGTKFLDASITSAHVAPNVGVVHPSADYTLTTSLADVTGLTATLTIDVPSYIYVTVFLCCKALSSAANTCYATVLYDDVDQGYYMACDNDNAADMMMPICQTWRIAATAGVHIIKVQAAKYAGAGSEAIESDGSTMFYEVFAS